MSITEKDSTITCAGMAGEPLRDVHMQELNNGSVDVRRLIGLLVERKRAEINREVARHLLEGKQVKAVSLEPSGVRVVVLTDTENLSIDDPFQIEGQTMEGSERAVCLVFHEGKGSKKTNARLEIRDPLFFLGGKLTTTSVKLSGEEGNSPITVFGDEIAVFLGEGIGSLEGREISQGEHLITALVILGELPTYFIRRDRLSIFVQSRIKEASK